MTLDLDGFRQNPTETHDTMRRLITWTRAKRRRLVIPAAILAALVPAVALAYFILSASGTVNSTSPAPITNPTPVALQVSANPMSVVGSNGFTASSWDAGSTEKVVLTVTNPSTKAVTINQAALTSWATDKAGCASNVGGLAPTFTSATIDGLASPAQIAAGGNVQVTVQVTMADLPNVDQTACGGATPTFTFAVS